jgi:hypothetical protein
MFKDLTKFFKEDVVQFLGQIFRYLVASTKEIMKEEDFLRIMFDKDKVIRPMIEQRKI